MDKNQAVIDFLLQCPAIAESPLFFNFVNAQTDNKQIITQSNDVSLNRVYVDGSVLRRYTFTIIDFRSVVYQPIPKIAGYVSENVEELLDVQGIIDWINEQVDHLNFPDFGDQCIVDDMRPTTDNPNLNGVDTNSAPALAKYSISIQIDYLDLSKAIWNN